MSIERVSITPAAAAVVERLKEENGELVFNQSGGCCDGTAPMCYAKGDFYVPSRNVKLGELCGCELDKRWRDVLLYMIGMALNTVILVVNIIVKEFTASQEMKITMFIFEMLLIPISEIKYLL